MFFKSIIWVFGDLKFKPKELIYFYERLDKIDQFNKKISEKLILKENSKMGILG